jgi:hypothetical protein
MVAPQPPTDGSIAQYFFENYTFPERVQKYITEYYSRNVMDVDWGLVVKLALPAKVTKCANKVIEIYDRSH